MISGEKAAIRPGFLLASLALAAGAAACGNSGPTPTLTQAELMDPNSCQQCHAAHYQEWSSSMHAYSGTDPVFLAMNARGQRETNHALGTFCVKCHAPMAVALGTTTDGTNLASLPADQTAVTCYFCHSATAVAGTHNAPITLATDNVLRASITDPVPNTGHKSAYEALLDRNDPSSASLCGSCHDIVNSLGVPLERTYEEWQNTIFSHGGSLELTCGECHMDGAPGIAAQYPGVPSRRVHAHTWPGVDIALTPSFPEISTQQAAVQASLDTTLQAALCVTGMSGQANIQVVLDNVAAGHLWPSGATQDRRAWVEVQAFSAGQVIYSSGVVADGQSVLDLKDPDLWLIRDCIFDAMGNEVNMFWQAASHDSNQLPGPTTNVQTDPAYYLTHVYRNYPQLTSTPSMLTTMPDQVTMRVRLVPVGLDVLDDLIQSGDLDPSVKAMMPTFDLAGGTLTWTAATATIKYGNAGLPVSCVSSGLALGAAMANPAPAHTNCSP